MRFRGSSRTARAWCVLGTLLLAAALAEAIVVAPHHVFIDHRSRSGVMYLHNPGVEPEEISIAFAFGYPASDSAGEVAIRFIEEPEPDAPSAAGWLQAFPRRLVVAPGQTRAVRLLARPPAGLSDGEYWARALVTSRGAEVPVASPDTGVRVGLTLEIRTVIPITYRKGELDTGAAIERLETDATADSLIARIGMRRSGNAAFLGTLQLALLDGRGAKVAGDERQVAVYFNLLRRIAIPVAGLPAGEYTLRVRLDTTRPDLAPEHVLAAPPLERRVPVRIPAE